MYWGGKHFTHQGPLSYRKKNVSTDYLTDSLKVGECVFYFTSKTLAKQMCLLRNL